MKDRTWTPDTDQAKETAKRISVDVQAEQYNKIKAFAVEEMRSNQNMVRVLLKEAIEAREKKLETSA